MRSETIAASYAKALLTFSVRRGADQSALLKHANLKLADLADPDARLPVATYIALMRAAKEMTGEPALALEFGAAFASEQLSIVGLLGIVSANLGQAAALVNRYTALIADFHVDGSAGAQRYAFLRAGNDTSLVDTRKDPNQFPEITESSFVRMVRSAQTLGDKQFIKSVHFTHAAPSHAEAYGRFFSMPVLFGRKRNEIVMANHWRQIEPVHASEYAFTFAAERAEALLSKLEAQEQTSGKVLGVLPLSDWSIDAVTKRLGMSRQALHRQLKAEGTTFVHLRNKLRLRLAKEHLLHGVSVAETATHLGFSDPAAFSRAFKRWAGVNPSTVHDKVAAAPLK